MPSEFEWVDVVRRWVPRSVRYAIQRHISLTGLKLRYRERTNPLAAVTESDDNAYGSPYRFGIVHNAAQYHSHYVAACLEMSVPFRVVDLARHDWLERVGNSKCDWFLVWPDASCSIWNRMVKDRVRILEESLDTPVFPPSRDLWAYEDKHRMAYWLQSHGVAHPRTWVFYDQQECLDFASSCALPVVYKASFGASATGVRVFRERRSLRRFIGQVFCQGFVPDGLNRRDRHWGSVLLQEFLPDVKEWRLVRIGESYFGHVKGRLGEFHSGSGQVGWDLPGRRHLDLLSDVTERGSFRSMAVDVFETTDGRLLVNELQAVFGASTSVDQLRKDGVPGRFVCGAGPGEWTFEAGDFARNACANERVRYVIENGNVGGKLTEGTTP